MNRRIEGTVNTLAGLTSEQLDAQKSKYDKICKEDGYDGLYVQNLWEVIKAISFDISTVALGIGGLQMIQDAFEHNNPIEAITGLVGIALATGAGRLTARAAAKDLLIGKTYRCYIIEP